MFSTSPIAPSPALERAFPDGSLPQPESPARKLLIRGWAVTAIAVTIAYLLWRLTGTIDLA